MFLKDLVLTIREVAKTLKVAEKTVYAMVVEGELPVFRVRGEWRMRRVDFDKWLANQVIATRQELASQANSCSNTPIATNLLNAQLTTSARKQPKEGPVSDQHLTDLTERVD